MKKQIEETEFEKLYIELLQNSKNILEYRKDGLVIKSELKDLLYKEKISDFILNCNYFVFNHFLLGNRIITSEILTKSNKIEFFVETNQFFKLIKALKKLGISFETYALQRKAEQVSLHLKQIKKTIKVCTKLN